MNQRNTFISGCLLGLLSVIFGAFGAHALKPILVNNGHYETFVLALQYQFYHTFALLIVGICMQQLTTSLLRYSALFFLIGVILFSGSLYVLCFSQIKVLGAVTPVGGSFFILGWLFLLRAVMKK